jgi:hypothetical protein
MLEAVRAEVWREAIQRHEGNISSASREFRFSRQRGFALTKAHGLTEMAAGLRLKHGGKRRGRPRGKDAP